MNTAHPPPCEISWFGALCDDDYEFLGVPDPALASSWEHCRDLVQRAESGGFDNILLPSGYALGIDTTAFAAAVAGDPGAGGGGVGGGLLGFSGSVGRILNELDGAEVAVDGAAEDVLDFKAGDGGFEFEGELPFVAIFCRDEFTVSEAEAAGPTDLIAGGFFLWSGGPECGRQKDQTPASSGLCARHVV